MKVSTDVKELQKEIESEEPEEVEEQQPFTEKYGIGNLISEILKAWGTRVGLSPEDVGLNEYEIEAVNETLNPIIKKLISKMGLEEDYFLGIIAVFGILLPKIFKIINAGRGVKRNDESNSKDKT